MQNSKLKLSLVSICLASCALASAQVKTISGQLTTDFGTILSKANVCVKGTNNCVQTDEDGRYSIQASEGDVIVISQQGYATQEITVGDDDNIDAVVVVEDIFALDLADLMNTEVTSSSFFSLKSKEVPGFTYSLDMKDVKAQGSLIEVARMILPSVSDGAHPDNEIIGVRGMKVCDNSKTMIMYDGQNLNLRSNTGYGIGLSSRLLGDVKSLEVSLGPNALVHGSGAISGYINMVPKNGFDNPGFFVNVNKEFEHDAENQTSGISTAEIGYGFGNKDRNAFFYAGWYYSNGWTADSIFATTRFTSLEQIQAEPYGNTPRANIRLSANGNFDGIGLNLGYMQNSRSSYASSSTLTHQEVFTRQFNAKLKYDRNIGDYESFNVSLRNELTDLGRFKGENSQSGGAEYHLEGRLIAKTTRIPNNSLAVGALWGKREFKVGKFYFGHDIDPTSNSDVSYEYDPATGKSYKTSDPETGEEINDPEYVWASGQIPQGEWKEFAVFLEDVYKVQDFLVISLGLRYDKFTIDEFDLTPDCLTPRIAASWILNDDHVVKASYQQGFRTPDYYNLGQTYLQKTPETNYFFTKGGLTDVNFKYNIKPERVHSVELNYQGDFFSKMLSFNVNVYYNIYKNTIDFYKLCDWYSDSYLADDTYRGDYTEVGKKYFSEELQQYFMINRVSSSYLKKEGRSTNYSAYVNSPEDNKIIGGEIIANLNLRSNTHVQASYSLSKSTTDSYSESTLHPEHQLKIGATQYLFSNNLMLNAQFAWEPAIEDDETHRENYADIYFNARTLLDASVSYRFKNVATIYVSANNLLAEDRPGITFKPDPSNNYPELTNLGCDQRRYWVGVKIDL